VSEETRQSAILVLDSDGAVFGRLREVGLPGSLWRVTDAKRLAGLGGMDLGIYAVADRVDWTVADAMLKYPDLPNHESWTPNLAVANALFGKFLTTMDSTPNLDMDTAINKLQADLDAAFKAAK